MKHRFITLDIFRGIFASFIVLFHMAFFSDTPVLNNPFVKGTDLFVDFFFVLSGFIISYNYSYFSNTQSFISFLEKRLYRIYPLHFSLLIVYLFLELLKYFISASVTIHQPINPDNNLKTFTTNLFLLNSIRWPGITNVSWNNPSWSISAEALSYLLYGLITYYFTSKKINNFRFGIYLGIIGFSFTMLYSITQSASIIYTYNYGFLRGFIGFFTGVLCFNTFNKYQIRLLQLSNYFFTYAELIIIIILIISIYLEDVLVDITIIYEIIFFIIIFIFSFQKGYLSQYFNKSQLLRNLGTYSYSIYLTHGLINTFFNVLFIRILKFSPVDYSYLFILNVVLVYYTSRWAYFTIERRFYKPRTSI